MNAIRWFLGRPWVRHVLRAQERYFARLGGQFAGAITYFFMLSLVPILMFSFAGVGLTLTVLRPELLVNVQDWVRETLSGAVLAEQVNGVIESALVNWKATGLIGCVTTLWWGYGLVSTFRTAIISQIQPVFEPEAAQDPLLKDAVTNLITLFVLLLVAGLMTGLAGFGTWLTDWIGQFLQWPGGSFLLKVTSTLGTVFLGWILFLVLFHTVRVHPDWRGRVAQGALVGAISLTILLFLASFIVGYFSENVTAVLFGPVIVFMLVSNLFVRLVIFTAAWIMTWVEEEPQPDEAVVEVEKPADPIRLSPWTTGFAVGAGAVAGLTLARRFARRAATPPQGRGANNGGESS